MQSWELAWLVAAIAGDVEETYDGVVQHFGSLDPILDVCWLDYLCEAQIDGEVVKESVAGDAVDGEGEEADDADDADVDADADGGDAVDLRD